MSLLYDVIITKPHDIYHCLAGLSTLFFKRLTISSHPERMALKIEASTHPHRFSIDTGTYVFAYFTY